MHKKTRCFKLLIFGDAAGQFLQTVGVMEVTGIEISLL